jgi:hypothetical protein
MTFEFAELQTKDEKDNSLKIDFHANSPESCCCAAARLLVVVTILATWRRGQVARTFQTVPILAEHRQHRQHQQR